MASQHLFNFLIVGSWLYLLAAGFYLSSISCRHFSLAAGGAVLLGPYSMIFTLEATDSGTFAAIVGLAVCGGFGWLYYVLSRRLFKRGARSDQLLLVSLGVLGLTENSIALVFGSQSRSLTTEYLTQQIGEIGSVVIDRSEALFLLVSLGILGSTLGSWQLSLFGKKFKALLESRTALALQGHDVRALELSTSILGSTLIGIAGILWAMTMRIRPAMGIEASVVGVVAFIVAPILASGPLGLLFSAAALALIRLALNLFAEGDWAMTSNLLLLFAALAVGFFLQGRSFFTRNWLRTT